MTRSAPTQDTIFQATRQRLALWYTLVTAVLLLLFASGFYLYVRHTLIERVDDTLKHVVEVVERAIPASAPTAAGPQILKPDRFLSQAGVTFPEGEEDHIELEWFAPTGERLWSTSEATQAIPLQLHRWGQTIQLPSGYTLRQRTEPIHSGPQLLGYLRVSHPWFEVTKPIRQLSIDLALGLSLMVSSTGAIGWFLSGLAMQPVRDSYQRLKRFTADASHELRSPIASIQTTVQVVLADPDLTPETRQSWAAVERLTLRLGRLVEDLLFLARQDSGIVPFTPRPCVLDGILLEVWSDHQPQAQEKQISLELELDPLDGEEEPFQLTGDPDQLARLFTNLISNAIQYTPSGGQITIQLQQADHLGQPGFQVQVQDTGIGIPPEAIPKLFERFYRVDPARSHGTKHPQQHSGPSGSGLGLAIAHAIVTSHQGRIQIQSQLGLGTTASVWLPTALVQSPAQPHLGTPLGQIHTKVGDP